MVAVQRTHRLSDDRSWVPAGARLGGWLRARRLPRLAGLEIALADVAACAEGALVSVRGTLDVPQPLRGVLVDVDGAYRRLIFAAGGTWVHEAATDFALVDDRGERVLVQAGGARWLVVDREELEYPVSRFDHDAVAPDVRDRVLSTGRVTIEASEQVLEPGTAVQVVGYKTTSPDVSGEIQGYRLPPQRATLRSGRDLPLVITRVADLS